MIRSAVSKVVWMARATTVVVGVAIMLGLIFGVATSAFGANGGNFILGSLNNTATAITKLTGTVGGGPALQVSNPSTATGSTALDLQVATGKAPMKVNRTTKVTNLNADRLDGLDSTALRVSCREGTRLLGGACIENTVRGTGDLPTSSSTCAGLGGRLPTAAELDAFRQFPDITIGNVGGLTLSGAEWTGNIVVDLGSGAIAMTDSGVYYPADKRNTQAFRCVVAPSG